ncbi:hypothetical protein HC341_15910 [Aquisalimonas sp. 2447]|uniref:hypothetical protein n=1 Tax=Aquisalimonas sp. 2447 TaxID=2740807 RepID=UPI00143256FF|nr:hypothetical protein [Aquisalimonas sp. 2447]QIT56550.1 hypothetical protein HC341_15910 [Aquisalimonas sp. 2447]
MPHWLNAHDGWKRICTRAGGEYLDPREDVETVLQQLQSVRLVVAEAMHGAIVADALRIPWIAVRASATPDDVKWEDWASSLEIPLEHHQLPKLPNRQSANLALRLWQQLIERRAARALDKLVTSAKPQLSDSNVLADRLNRLETLLESLKRDINQRRFG